jgi:PAS domain-containing protein
VSAEDRTIELLERENDKLKSRIAALEAEARRYKRSLQEAERAAHLGNWDWDAVNDEITGSEEFYRLFDVAPEGLARLSQFVERLHPDDRARVQQDVADALNQARPYDTDYRVKLSDGGWRDLIACRKMER